MNEEINETISETKRKLRKAQTLIEFKQILQHCIDVLENEGYVNRIQEVLSYVVKYMNLKGL